MSTLTKNEKQLVDMMGKSFFNIPYHIHPISPAIKIASIK